VLEGQQGGVEQSGAGGTIEVDDGTLEIEGNSNFYGTFASAAGMANGSTGTVELVGGAFYNFYSGVALNVAELELLSTGLDAGRSTRAWPTSTCFAAAAAR